jgi:hypothetical protein
MKYLQDKQVNIHCHSYNLPKILSMTGQEKGDCLIEVTTWTGLTVF